MGFNLKKLAGVIGKAAAAPVKLAGKIIKTPVGTVATKVLRPVYESAVPQPVRRIITGAVSLAPLAKLFQKGSDSMNPYERAMREIGDVTIAIRDKKGTTEIIGEIVQSISAANDALAEFNQASLEQKRTMIREALDNVIGEEPNALFGPNGSLVKFDIPFVGDEAATDLALTGLVKLAIKEKTE